MARSRVVGFSLDLGFLCCWFGLGLVWHAVDVALYASRGVFHSSQVVGRLACLAYCRLIFDSCRSVKRLCRTRSLCSIT